MSYPEPRYLGETRVDADPLRTRAPREDYLETMARVAEAVTTSDEERVAFFVHDTYCVNTEGRRGCGQP